MPRRRLVLASALALPGLVLAGCSSAGADADAGGAAEGSGFSIVASTSVYASLVSELVGDAAEVTAIVDSPTQDPHSYEATARDQLAVQEADLVVLNGGGYDPFMEQLADEAGVEHVITAVEYSHEYPGAEDEHAEDEHAEGEATEEAHDHEHEGHDHIEGFNEHVWYDPYAMADLVEALGAELGELLPDAGADIQASQEDLLADIEGLEASLEGIAADHGGAHAFFTEPVGGYLAEAAGLEDATAEGFAEAVEEGQDVPPATLLAALDAIEGGEIDVLITNTQTAGAETQRVIDAAGEAGVPVVEYAETLPEGETYVSWMTANAEALEQALAG
ncbi:metal ABC transporter substrate-binding protein [Microbacterium paludicola]|uniref:Metal ABC transporter substrate-binding protein n=1 Tax=Microbacterium paludicola TaxID=300019 RepID=A0A4Y9FVC9_9MICO|nr:zinc ABC transporter substrate-binding protein [Microbacterium paludicola]MBF0817111.1 zinc ABC transporter substrate-binding protein [Microbacterium paludicola]TFU32175.1 metal ABC transporter substrate-binding protein [Microbacterium paludicola]